MHIPCLLHPTICSLALAPLILNLFSFSSPRLLARVPGGRLETNRFILWHKKEGVVGASMPHLQDQSPDKWDELKKEFREYMDVKSTIDKQLEVVHRALMAKEAAELAEALKGLPVEAVLNVEKDILNEIHRLGMVARQDVFGKMTDAQYYVKNPLMPPAEFVFTPHALYTMGWQELRELISTRMFSCVRKRRGVRYSYVGLSTWAPDRWGTYKGARSMWRCMQVLLVIDGVGASELIGFLESVGIRVLWDELGDVDGEPTCFGRRHPDFTNKSGGGESVMSGARYFVLYIVTADDGAVELEEA